MPAEPNKNTGASFCKSYFFFLFSIINFYYILLMNRSVTFWKFKNLIFATGSLTSTELD